MKFNLYKYIILSFVVAICSCGDDYLQLEPQEEISLEQAMESPTNAQAIINGTCRSMAYNRYLDNQAFNGEAQVHRFRGELPGADLQHANLTGYKNNANSNYNTNNTSTYTVYPWYYYYKLIGNLNQLLVNIPKSPEAGTEKDWTYIEAQALTMRSYFYFMLSQIYCRRWADRDGESRGLPLRLDDSRGNLAPSSLAQVYEQVYKDLDRALSLFEESGQGLKATTTSNWKPTAQLAHAIYSRAALTRHDWATCIEHSQKAREGRPLMNAEQYADGFSEPNDEWIWSTFTDETQNMAYASIFGYFGTNVSTSSIRSYPPLISKDLIVQIPSADKRLPIYCVPKSIELSSANAKLIKNNTALATGPYYERIKEEYVNVANYRIHPDINIYYYIGTKFQAPGNLYSVGCWNIFRSAEMIYNEAEAQLELDNLEAARTLLEEAVAPYNESFSASNLTSRARLENSLRVYRRFDLWGEGYSWFDLKRWNTNMTRRTWADGGSWNTDFAGNGADGGNGGNYGPSDKNNWTVVYPIYETDYNSLVTPLESDDWKIGDK